MKINQLSGFITNGGSLANDHRQHIPKRHIHAPNRLMNESILPDGKSIIGMRIFEFDPAYKDTEMVRAVTHVIETGESRTFTTAKGRAARMLGKIMKTTIIPVERDGERRALSVSHEITDSDVTQDFAAGEFHRQLGVRLIGFITR